MEILIAASLIGVTFGVTVSAIHEHMDWMNSYKRAGEEDREYQLNKKRKIAR